MLNGASYTVVDLVEMLGLSPAKIHRLFEEDILVATRVDGVLRVPAEFLQDGQPVAALKGTATVLRDAGLDSDEIVNWLLCENEFLGQIPIALLRANQKAKVRAAAQLLA